MDTLELIRTRKSVRTFDGGRCLWRTDVRSWTSRRRSPTPYGIPVSFVFLDAAEHGLSSYVITGERLYVAGKVPQVDRCEEAFGYTFEKLVLFAWSRDIGTTWIGRTMSRELFERAADTQEDEFMPIVSPLGYPSKERSEVDVRLRETIHGDERLEPADLFFEGDFSSPVASDACDEVLEAVRWAPSAANRQPCRVVTDGGAYHLYVRYPDMYRRDGPWDVCRIDAGIALCHLMSVRGGRLDVTDPGIATDADTFHVATVHVG